MHHRITLLCLLVLGSTILSGQKNNESCDSEKAYLGINYALLSSEKASLLGFNNPYGDYVTKVIKNTAADRDGIQIFDYIYGLNDFRVGKDNHLGKVLNKYQPGDKVVFHIYRKGKALAVPVTLGVQSDVLETPESQAFFGVSQHSGHEENKSGVKINVIENSTAQEMGLQNGDLILTINAFPMITWSDITTVVEAMEPGDRIKVSYIREGQKMKGEATLKSLGQTKQYVVVKQKTQEMPYLGIQYDHLPKEKAKKMGINNFYGTYITLVYEQTAAEKAGLMAFDYLVGIDDYIFGAGQDLAAVMQKYRAGDKAVLHIIRDGGAVDLDVVFGDLSDKRDMVVDKCKKAFFGIIQINSNDNWEGVVVDIVANSTAESMGLQKGDMILQINNHHTYDWTDITAAIYQLKVGDKIEVQFLRNGKTMKKSAPIKSYCETKKTEGIGEAEFMGKEVESWSSSAPRMMEEGDPVDINNVDLMISDITLQEAELMHYKTESSDLQVDFLSINPDPESGKFLLEFNLSGIGDLNVRLHNGAGREIYSYETADFTGPFSDTVNISQNGTGNYFIEITHGDKYLSKKITLAAL
ncbi:MAG: PDZ domain-containing protein [Lewinellaceae bacterium]|nr:PDZ domain-containing protein [Lewinellaceae bacterium]